MDAIESIVIRIRICCSDRDIAAGGGQSAVPIVATAIASAVASVERVFPHLEIPIRAGCHHTSAGMLAGLPEPGYPTTGPRSEGGEETRPHGDIDLDDIDLDVDLYESGAQPDLDALDRRVREAMARPRRLSKVFSIGASVQHADACGGVLARYQRYLAQRNAESKTDAFEEALRRHRFIHDTRKPLVLADYEHALDTWQWTLRLDPKASAACQLAALYHDVARLVAESNQRVEQHAHDYAQFKNAHAVRGALMMRELLCNSPLPTPLLSHACSLVARHEAVSTGQEAATLVDADALSFFSLNSPGFLDYFGEQHARRKIDHTLGRMSPRAMKNIAQLWMRADVKRIVEERIAIATGAAGEAQGAPG